MINLNPLGKITMNAVMPFDFEGMAVRVTDQSGEPWFVLADVCRVLEHSNPAMAASRLDDDEKATLNNTEGQAGHGAQSFTIINESGLYSLILTSRKPAAKRFKKWVTSEVLPAIRKTGRYEAAPVRSAVRGEVPPGIGSPLVDSILPAVLPLLDQCISDRIAGNEPEHDSNGMTEAERKLIALVRNAPWAAHCEAVACALEEKAKELRGEWLPFLRAKDCYRAAILFVPDLAEHVRRTAVVMIELASVGRFDRSGDLVTRIETKQLALSMAVDRTTLQHRQKIMREVGMVEVEEVGGGRGRPCVYRFSRGWLEQAATAIQATNGFNHDALPADFYAFAGVGRGTAIGSRHSHRLAVANALDEMAMQTRRSA